MYVPSAFKTDDGPALAFCADRSFGTLIVSREDQPFAVHVPFLMDEDATGRVRLACHVARANPIHALMGDRASVLMIVHGPDAYISPDWYLSAEQVPTWNYVAVHLAGYARTLPREAALTHVEALSDAFEERLRPKKPWRMSKVSAKRQAALLAAIVPLEIIVETVTAQWKLGQHKSAADQASVLTMLGWRGDWGSLGVAQTIRQAARLAVPSGTSRDAKS